MSTDVYSPQVNILENRIMETSSSPINADFFYTKYPDLTDQEVKKEFSEGKVDYISLPKESLRDPKTRIYLLGRIAQNPEIFLSKHALETHPRNSKIATKLLYRQAVKNPKNISCNTRTPEAHKKQEATRVTLSTNKPIGVRLSRHVHLQMALELVEQVREGKAENHVIEKSLRRLAHTSPGFATMICCLLRYYSPKIRGLNVGYNEIFSSIPALKENRYEDRRMIQDIATELEDDNKESKDDIPTEKRIDRVIEIIEDRFPEEREKLGMKAKFREKIYPYLVLESAYNIIQNLCHENGASFDTKVAKQLPRKLEETVTCKIVTAYLKHLPQLSLGPTSVMLTEKKLTELSTRATK